MVPSHFGHILLVFGRLRSHWNDSNRSVEGLTIETLALESLNGDQFTFATQFFKKRKGKNQGPLETLIETAKNKEREIERTFPPPL